MASLFDGLLSPEELAPVGGNAPAPAAPSTTGGSLFGSVMKPEELTSADDIDRRNKLKQIAYQSMTGDLGNKDANDLMSLGDIGIHGYTWGAARPLSAAINALPRLGDFTGGDTGWPAGTSFADRYAASESAYDQKLAEDRAQTGGVGKMVGATGTVASLAGPAEIGALTMGGDAVKAAMAARGPVLKWLGEHSFKPALDLGTGSAVQGAAENRGSIEDRAKAALIKGTENAVVAGIASPVISATTGAVSPLVTAPVKAVYNRFAGPAAEAAAPAAEAGTAAAPSAAPDMAPVYDRFRGSNTAYSYNQLADFSKDLTARMGSANINAAAEPIATKIYNATGTATPEELAALRSEASGMTGSADPHQQKVGQIMVNALDDFTGGTSPAKTSLAPDELNSLMNQYRQGMAPPTPAPAADVGAGAPTNAAGQGSSLLDEMRKNSPYRNALSFIDQKILHPATIAGTYPAVSGVASYLGADPVTANILGGTAATGAAALKAGLGVAARRAPVTPLPSLLGGGAAAELSPAEQAVLRSPGPSREKLALMRASQMLLPVMATNTAGGGGGGQGW
jgi:hypothetical protein